MAAQARQAATFSWGGIGTSEDGSNPIQTEDRSLLLCLRQEAKRSANDPSRCPSGSSKKRLGGNSD